jgi:hypothetical protein
VYGRTSPYAPLIERSLRVWSVRKSPGHINKPLASTFDCALSCSSAKLQVGGVGVRAVTAARARVGAAKRGLGERGTPWREQDSDARRERWTAALDELDPP